MSAVALAMAVSVGLVGCSNANNTPDSTTDPTTSSSSTSDGETDAPASELADPSGTLTPADPTEISVWITSANQAPADDNKITKLIEQELGVTLKYEIVTPDNVDQKIGVMLAGGQFPDLVGTTDLQMRLLEGGALLPLDEMLATGD